MPLCRWLTSGGTPLHFRPMDLPELQSVMRTTYFARDSARGVDATFRWLTEEVGELAKAIRSREKENLRHEFGDALAWLASLANLLEIDLDEAARRYANGCPKCGLSPCECSL